SVVPGSGDEVVSEGLSVGLVGSSVGVLHVGLLGCQVWPPVELSGSSVSSVSSSVGSGEDGVGEGETDVVGDVGVFLSPSSPF
ncbi:hypothetical protein JVW19_21030, partial [Vibrio cholerae O1]|nr:hypothetical protein [Vibrio cholerae O1]